MNDIIDHNVCPFIAQPCIVVADGDWRSVRQVPTILIPEAVAAQYDRNGQPTIDGARNYVMNLIHVLCPDAVEVHLNVDFTYNAPDYV